MSVLIASLWSDVGYRVSWTIVQSIWQLAVVALLVAAILRFSRRASPQPRYIVACGGLFVMTLLPVITFIRTQAPDPGMTLEGPQQVDGLPRDGPTIALEERESDSRPHAGAVPMGEPASSRDRFGAEASRSEFGVHRGSPIHTVFSAVSAYVPICAWFWLLGVAVSAAANLRAWLVASRLHRLGAFPADEQFLQRVAALRDRMGIRQKVQSLQSSRIDGPIVLGWLRPVILVPVGMMTSVPVAQLDGILAHELSHIRRHDYLVNLLQAAAETLLFFHPAAWWISRRIRVEREHCCDDAAIAMCGDRIEFAKALSAIEQLRAGVSFAVAATGSRKAGNTVNRIRRILGNTEDFGRLQGLLGGTTAVLLTAVFACLAIAAERGDRSSRYQRSDSTAAPSSGIPAEQVIELQEPISEFSGLRFPQQPTDRRQPNHTAAPTSLSEYGAEVVLRDGKPFRVNLTERFDVRGLKFLDGSTTIEELHAMYCRELTDADMVHFSEIVNLKKLYLPANIGDDGLQYVQGLTKLEVLYLNDGQFTAKGMAHLKRLTNLVDLSLWRCTKINDAGFEHIKAMKQLKRLDLRRCALLTDRTLLQVKDLTSLEILDFSVIPGITNDGLRHIRTLKHLRSLGTTRTGITSLEPVRDLTGLESLNVPAQIDDAQIAHLEGLTKLRRLSLECCPITDDAVAHLRNMKDLEWLDIHKTGVTDSCLRHLQALKNLKYLQLQNTNVSEQGFKQTKTSLPSCEVIPPWHVGG